MTRLDGVLDIDVAAVATALADELREAVVKRLRRRGLVVAVSGGVDSACVAALSAKAVGADRVLALLLPERESSEESVDYARRHCESLGLAYVVSDITAALEAVGCYAARTEAVRSVFPAFEPTMPWKIVLASDPLRAETLHFFQLVVETGPGEERRFRLTPSAYLQVVAATNFKQRVRKMLEYYHADRLSYAVAGTSNRLEYDQGFFVKAGDGAADVKPIAGLYKTQVYALARHLGVSEEILSREPTTDTYSLAQSQEDFYYSLPYPQLDIVLWAKNHQVPADVVGEHLGYRAEQVRRVYEDIDQKRRTTAYLHAPPVLLNATTDPLDLEPTRSVLG